MKTKIRIQNFCKHAGRRRSVLTAVCVALGTCGLVLLPSCGSPEESDVSPATAQRKAQGAVAMSKGPSSAQAYSFPVLPGSPAWAALSSHDEMLAVTQIPADRLASLSTGALAATVLAYPLRLDLLAYNDPQAGLRAMAEGFNGLKELLQRPDVGAELFARYRQLSVATVDDLQSAEAQGERSFELTLLELLLGQPQVLASLPEAERKALLGEGLAKVEAKTLRASVFGEFSRGASALLVGKTLLAIVPEAQHVAPATRVKEIVERGGFPDSESIEVVLSTAAELRNTK